MNNQIAQILQKFSIDADKLERAFSPRTVQRGYDYYQRNKVLGIFDVNDRNNGKTLIVEGDVSGSGQTEYQTTLIMVTGSVHVTVSSECSCPVVANCKHGVALLFLFLETVAGELETEEAVTMAGITPELDEWLEAITADNQRDPLAEQQAEAAEAQFHLLYLLDLKEQIYHREKKLQLTVVKARRLKAGGYGVDYKADIHSILTDPQRNYSAASFYYSSDDSEIIQRLEALESGRSSYYTSGTYSLLDNKASGSLLMDVIASGRCYWHAQQKSQPLHQGQDIPVKLEWQDEGDKKRIALSDTPKNSLLLPLGDLCYLTPDSHTFGRLVHETLSYKQIKYFLKAPPVPLDKAKALTDKLLEIFHEVEVPLPAVVNIENIELQGVVPRFHLHLHAEPIPSPSGQTRFIHIASLGLQYDSVTYQPVTQADVDREITVFLQDQTRYKIHRDHAAEQDALAKLAAYGFSSLDPTLSSYGLFDMIIYATEGLGLSSAIERWDHFRSIGVPLLEAAGWTVSVDDNFQLEIGTVDDWHAELEESEGGDWFEMSLGFELDGKRINLLPLLLDLLAADNQDTKALRARLQEQEYQLLQVDDYQWVKIPCQRLLTVLDTLIELYDAGGLNAAGNLEFSKYEGMHYGELLNDPSLRWKGADELKTLNKQLQAFSGIVPAELPQGLQAELREYQQIGYNWLQFLQQYQFNGILADDMGLGKTLQALCVLLAEKEAGRATLPSLIIAPTSLMSNWRREVEKFTPDLKVLTLQGHKRKAKFDQLADYDLVLTTYPLIIRDSEVYEKQAFHYLILDEAQAIKNAKAKSTQQIYALESNHRLCLSGTPIENHLGELWSMFHFLMPGYLGTQERFNRLFRTPIEKHGDTTRGEKLRKRIQPFMLRRTKDLVAKELPEKTEMIRSVPLSGKQRDLYETVRLAMDKKVRDEISKKGLARSHIMILDALLKLRQVCCDPQLVKLQKARTVKESAKFELLMSMLPEMVEEGRKILVFSQFTAMLAIIEKALIQQKISYTKLTGQTRKREEAINLFQDGDAAVFLISLKAGGTGLNLTAADTVIHYDPWWNPAVEQQATDRAYRLGQDKPVFVYKLLTEETVEEKILQLQAKKQALADSVYGDAKQDIAIGQQDLMELLKPLS